MKAKGPKENFRVVVTPRSMTDYGFLVASRGLFYGHDAEGQKRWEADMQRRCQDIEQDIKRHVDSVGSVDIECDQADVCGYCGYAWGEKGDQYNGGCCAKDEENNPDQATA